MILGIPNRVIKSTPRRMYCHTPRGRIDYNEDTVDEGPQEVEAMDESDQEIEFDTKE